MKLLRRLLFVVVLLATLIALFYAEEDWRGARELAKTEKELQARGETLKLEELIPPVPDSENAAKASLFVDLFEKDQAEPEGWKKSRIAALALPAHPKKSAGSLRDAINLNVWQQALTGQSNPPTAGRDVLDVLGKQDALLAELKEALARPHFAWPIHWKYPAVTHQPYVQEAIQVGQYLNVKASAEIAVGDGKAAEEDILFSRRLSQAIRENGFLVDHIVAGVIDNLGFRMVREGLMRKNWDLPQLEELRSAFRDSDERADFLRNIRIERASALSNWRVVERHSGLWPVGWFKLDEVFFCRWVQADLIDSDSAEATDMSHYISVQKTAVAEAGGFGRKPLLFRITHLLSSISIPIFAEVGIQSLHQRVFLQAAQTACALEEYRLAQGSLPHSLDILVPTILPSLPLDPITGRPLIYKREVGDGYLLYSPGWNLKDDGGVVGRKDGKDDPESGDWVWASRPDLYRFTE